MKHHVYSVMIFVAAALSVDTTIHGVILRSQQ